MKRPNITTGEWEVQDSYTALFHNDLREETVYEVNGREAGNSPAYATSETNARFIAAAPDMAKALEDCIQSLWRLPETEGAYKFTCIAQAKDALIKAGYEFP